MLILAVVKSDFGRFSHPGKGWFLSLPPFYIAFAGAGMKNCQHVFEKHPRKSGMRRISGKADTMRTGILFVQKYPFVFCLPGNQECKYHGSLESFSDRHAIDA
ncbi:hypothetical protein LJC19_06340 [Oxalobacter sp. OttesenSCG-928-P03]|nr:hypothetical protein [Oxalobacter sp. OttesenSCG-928-P03]